VPDAVEIRALGPADVGRHLDGLADVLLDCVAGGASVSYLAPFTHADARAAMAGFADEVAAGRRILLAAFDEDGGVVGTVQMSHAAPPNQPHRGDVAKLLVHRRARGRGVAALLMERLEVEARAAGKTLLVLDTVTGSVAERVYTRLGWERVGEIPNYALMPDGEQCSTTIFYKALA
jgi:GNAT superfamily N-acetyltransferase